MAASAVKNGRCLLFDLDGTLTDNYEGISRCVIHALEAMGCVRPDDLVLRGCVGPPLRHSFARILATDDREQIESAITLYRDFADAPAKHDFESPAAVPHIFQERMLLHAANH